MNEIEEMAKFLCNTNHKCSACPIQPCLMYNCAKYIYSKGYRMVERGEWEFDGSGWACSVCGKYALYDKHREQKYSDNCPHCGANMRGEKE